MHRETIVKGTTIDSVAIIKSKYNSILIIVMVKHFQGLLNERVSTGMLIERLSAFGIEDPQAPKGRKVS